MSVCNNDVTYHEKWDTMANNAAKKKLDEKYFDRCYYSPSCPVAWAPEVLELFERLDKEFGIKRNTGTIRAYTVKETLIRLIFVATYNNLKFSIKQNFLGVGRQYKNNSLRDKLRRVELSVLEPLIYAWKVFRMRYLNHVVNFVLRPKFSLQQVKEKYGYLTLYFDCPPEYKEYVDGLVNDVIMKLAEKGAYYSVESILAMREERRKQRLEQESS